MIRIRKDARQVGNQHDVAQHAEMIKFYLKRIITSIQYSQYSQF